MLDDETPRLAPVSAMVDESDREVDEDSLDTGEKLRRMHSVQHSCDGCTLLRDHPLVLTVNLILVVLLVYIGTIFLYRFSFMAFHIDESGSNPLGAKDMGWNVWEYIVDAFFWFDLVFNFFLAYEDENGHEVTNMRLIAKRYLSGRFWLNLLACLPEEAIRELFNLTSHSGFGVARLYRLQRVSKLARLSRLSRLAKLANLRTNLPFWEAIKTLRGVRVMNFLCGLLFTCHLLACGWYLTAAFHDDVKITWVGRRTFYSGGEEKTLLSATPFEQWVVAMYFILTVFTTVGFGDIFAHTEAEILFVLLVMLVGTIVHSIIISEVIQVVTSTDRKDAFIEKNASLFDAFASHVGLSEETTRSARDALEERSWDWVSSASFDKEEMKSLLLSKYLPREIVGMLPDGLYQGKLGQNLFLQVCSSSFPLPPRLPSLLAVHLMPAEFMSGEIAFQMHDFAFHLDVVLSGAFAFVGHPLPGGGIDTMDSAPTDNDSQQLSTPLFPYKLFGPKTYFGDFEVLHGLMRRATMRCESQGETLLLKKHDFFELMEEFPQFGDVWASAAQHRESLRKRALSRLRHPHSYKAFAAITIQRAYRAKQSRVVPRSSAMLEQLKLLAKSQNSSTSGPGSSSHSGHASLRGMATPEKSLSFVMGEVTRMSGVMGKLQIEMQQHNADITEVKEALDVLLRKQEQGTRRC